MQLPSALAGEGDRLGRRRGLASSLVDVREVAGRRGEGGAEVGRRGEGRRRRGRGRGPRERSFSRGVQSLNVLIFQNFANFWRARPRLYQNEIWQENMRLTAFFKLYKICILLHRCNLKKFSLIIW